MDNTEQRKYRRMREGCSVKIEVLDEVAPSKDFQVGKSKNLSACGVLLTYSNPIEIEKLIDISFLSPNSFELFTLTAKVARVQITPDKTYEIGVEFLDLNEDDTERLDYYLTIFG